MKYDAAGLELTNDEKVPLIKSFVDPGGIVRFHFQVRTGTHVMITEAAEFADTDQARIEAAKRIGLLLHDHAGKLWADEDWQMDVTDETGLILFVISIAAMRSAATHK